MEKHITYEFKTIRDSVRRWLEEDIGPGDVSSLATVSDDHASNAIIHAKQSGIVAGIPIAMMVFEEVDPSLQVKAIVTDGDDVSPGEHLLELNGKTRSILAAERLALNVLQRLSGIATQTRVYVDALTHSDHVPRIVDTRKTTPGMRLLEKYAVRIGGGHNHRFGLYDAVMLKDNHIKAGGGIEVAIRRVRANVPHTLKVEVEVESLQQVQEAVHAGADIIMLDNMSIELMTQAVQLIRQAAPRTIIEASGGVNQSNVREIAQTGVDVISIGGLTHSVKAMDISLDLFEKKEPQI
jgi:nicotinate-nucleotide pyrophosphorylase (carboxylating)